jgi:arylsulfatase A-like enzyme
MIHVPLVLRLPPRYGPMPARTDSIVELRDLVPTLCHALRVSCRAGRARSLLQMLRMKTPRPRIARAWTSDGDGRARGAIVTTERKVIMDVPQRLLVMYDLRQDAHEGWNLAPEDPVRARRLVRQLRAPRPKPMLGSVSAPVSDETVQKLRAIGYVE